MSSLKKLKSDDISLNSYKVHKEWIINSDPFPDNDYIKYFKGVKKLDRFLLEDDRKSNNHYDTLNYELINNTFYYSFDGINLDTGSLRKSLYHENINTGSNEKENTRYNNSYPEIINEFPTTEYSEIYIIQIGKEVMGERIMPLYYKILSNLYDIRDDGFGNLCDHFNNKVHVGNIFYNHGIVVITNQNYINKFPEIPVAIDDYITI